MPHTLDAAPVVVAHPDGTIQWLLDGALHRTDGPAVTHPDGSESWWEHGQRHRDGGPAVTSPDGDTEWWHHGRRHRLDGPAVCFAPGAGPDRWFVRGVPLDHHEQDVLTELHDLDPRLVPVVLSLWPPRRLPARLACECGRPLDQLPAASRTIATRSTATRAAASRPAGSLPAAS